MATRWEVKPECELESFFVLQTNVMSTYHLVSWLPLFGENFDKLVFASPFTPSRNKLRPVIKENTTRKVAAHQNNVLMLWCVILWFISFYTF